MSHTSQEWWNSVKQSPVLLQDWLVKQHRGEVTAADRIMEVAVMMCQNSKHRHVLEIIAEQERQHADWVLDLLKTRNIEPNTALAEERYWKTVKQAVKDFSTACAVAAHAENMRLERIRVICNDQDAESDIRETFQRILKDEEFHERAFREMAGEFAMSETQEDHEAGLKLLGLVI